MTASISGGAPKHVATAAGPISRTVGVLLRESDLTGDYDATQVVECAVEMPAGAYISAVLAECLAAFGSTGAYVTGTISWSDGVDILGNAVVAGTDTFSNFDAVDLGPSASGMLQSGPYLYYYPTTLTFRVTISGVVADKALRTGVVAIVVHYSVPEYELFTSIYAD